jgi:hypothetical protein
MNGINSEFTCSETALQQAAPPLPAREPDFEKVPYLFANDACNVTDLEAVRDYRIGTDSYRAARNPTAIIIGEGALAASLQYLPESQIVLLDYSADMCLFMNRYVEALQTMPDPDAWTEMVFKNAPFGSQSLLNAQISDWENNGQSHALYDDEVFFKAQQLARKKTFIPWSADITSPTEIANLSQVLTKTNSQITFMNLTNVIPYAALHSDMLPDAQAFADLLIELPITKDAPIVTTAGMPRNVRSDYERWRARMGSGRCEATGPFFGLEGLARGGSLSENHPGPINRLTNLANLRRLVIRASTSL